jgi:hypothetical protein
VIPQRVRGRGRVEIGELPAVEVAVVRTRDEDEAAEEGYATLKNWLAEQGHVLRGAKREVPLEGSGAPGPASGLSTKRRRKVPICNSRTILDARPGLGSAGRETDPKWFPNSICEPI